MQSKMKLIVSAMFIIGIDSCSWCSSYEPDLSTCITDSGGWTLVRSAGPAQTRWFDNNDWLQGTDAAVDDAVTEQFNIGTFTDEVAGFNQYLFISGDCTVWLISGKSQVNPIGGWYSNSDRRICASSISSTQYDAKWYYRSGNQEDPWITTVDHHSAAVADFVYGENRDLARAATIANKDGMFVYIRNAGSLDSTGCNPTNAPTPSPSISPTTSPSKSPSKSPTISPTKSPTASPTTAPSVSPTDSPTKHPTESPTPSPSASPSLSPSNSPTTPPTKAPTKSPSKSPTSSPTKFPSQSPTSSPTLNPTSSPTKNPTSNPSRSPSKSPSSSPSVSPSLSPTKSPSLSPSISPTGNPSQSPSMSPSSNPSLSPSISPSTSPTTNPSQSPTKSPTESPSQSPSLSPTQNPSISPSQSPSNAPTQSPTMQPSKNPTVSPSISPTLSPTNSPTQYPTQNPTKIPAISPSSAPTQTPIYASPVLDFMNDTSVEVAYNEASQILTNESNYADQSIIDDALDSLVEILQNVNMIDLDYSPEEIQSIIQFVAENAITINHGAQILCLNALLVTMIADDEIDERCDIAQQARNMTDMFTTNLVSVYASENESVSINSSCDETGIADIDSFGAIIDPESGLNFSNNDGLSITMQPMNDSEQMQLNAVTFSGSIAQHCMERDFAQNDDGIDWMNSECPNQYVLSDFFVNVTIVNASTNEYSDCIHIGLPDTESNDNLVFIDEDNGGYSDYGISKINETSFCTSHLTAFCVAKNVKANCKNNQMEHIIVGSIALFLFLTMQIMVIYHFRREHLNLRKTLTKKLLFVMFLSLSAHIINEIMLIAFYSPNTAQHESFTNFITFLVLLPSIIHFWVFMIALFSWLKIFYDSSLTKTEQDMQNLKTMFISVCFIFSSLTFIICVFITSVNDKEMAKQMCDIYGIIMSVFVILIAIITKIVSLKLIKNYKMRAKKANAHFNEALTQKLSITGNVMFVSFIIYAVVTFISIFNEPAYTEHDFLYDFIIDVADISSIAVVFYLYSGARPGSALNSKSSSRRHSRSRSRSRQHSRSRRQSIRINKRMPSNKITLEMPKISEDDTMKEKEGQILPSKSVSFVYGQNQIVEQGEIDNKDYLYNSEQPGASMENLLQFQSKSNTNEQFQQFHYDISSDEEEEEEYDEDGDENDEDLQFDMRKYIEAQLRAKMTPE